MWEMIILGLGGVAVFVVALPLLAFLSSRRAREEVRGLRAELAELRSAIDRMAAGNAARSPEAPIRVAPAPAAAGTAGSGVAPQEPVTPGPVSASTAPMSAEAPPARVVSRRVEPPPLPMPEGAVNPPHATIVRPAAGGTEDLTRDMGARTTEALQREMLGGPAPGRRTPPELPPPDGAVEAAPIRRDPPSARPLPNAYEAETPSIVDRVRGWLFGGNTIARLGVLILFCGVAFLLKYAWDAIHVPPVVRLAGVAAGGVVLFALGWRLRATRRDYGLSLQGAAIGVLYLTVFAALRIWPVLGAPAAFGLMVALVVACAVLAVRQDALALAVLGMAGGYAAPILASTGEGNHVVLFTYYGLLNVGVAIMAGYRAWRPLNLLGFAATFLVALAWGMDRYHAGLFGSTEPFLVFHYLLYVAIAILFARAQSTAFSRNVDGSLVFGVPFAAFALQSGLVAHLEHGLALSAVAMGGLYLALAVALRSRDRARYGMLQTAFIALGLIFLSLAVPLAFSARWTAASWAIEGAGLVWLGLRQQAPLVRAMGIVALLVAIGAAVHDASEGMFGQFDPGMLLARVILVCGLVFASRQYARAAGPHAPPEESLQGLARMRAASDRQLGRDGRPTIDFAAGPTLFTLAVLAWLWCGSLLPETLKHDHVGWHAFLAFTAASAYASSWAGARMRWHWPRHAAHALGPLMLFFLAVEVTGRHPFSDLGALAWPVAILLALLVLHREEPLLPRIRPWRHALLFWIVVTLTTWEAYWQLYRGLHLAWDWGLAVLGIVPSLWMLAVERADGRLPWPVSANRFGYLGAAIPPVVAALTVWSLVLPVLSNGKAPPLPYVPFLAPVDVAQWLPIVAGALWYRNIRHGHVGFFSIIDPRAVAVIAGVLGFVAFNTVLLRTLHHYAAVPYDPIRMVGQPIAQATFAIAWSLLAAGLMSYGVRRGMRAPWLTGAALLGIVVVKLLVFDLAAQATVLRIVAFIGVGLLMLAIGYFAPLPPRGAGDDPPR